MRRTHAEKIIDLAVLDDPEAPEADRQAARSRVAARLAAAATVDAATGSRGTRGRYLALRAAKEEGRADLARLRQLPRYEGGPREAAYPDRLSEVKPAALARLDDPTQTSPAVAMAIRHELGDVTPLPTHGWDVLDRRRITRRIATLNDGSFWDGP